MIDHNQHMIIIINIFMHGVYYQGRSHDSLYP